MPTIVDFGEELGQVDFGELTQDQLKARPDLVRQVRERLILQKQQANEATTAKEVEPTLTAMEKFQSGIAAARESAGTMVGQGVSMLGRFLASAPIPSDPFEADRSIAEENIRRARLTPAEMAAEQEASPVIAWSDCWPCGKRRPLRSKFS